MRTENEKRGRSNRGKGLRWNQECVNHVKFNGWPKAKRQRYDRAGDIVGVPGLCLECKDTDWQAVPAALDQAARDAVALDVPRGVVMLKRAGHRKVADGLWLGRVGAELATARAAGYRVAASTRALAAPLGGHTDPGAAGLVESRVEAFAPSILAVCQYVRWLDVPAALDAARDYAATTPGLFSRVVLIKRQRGNDDPMAGYWIGTIGAELAAERDRQGAGVGPAEVGQLATEGVAP
jgi:hypothetical protein